MHAFASGGFLAYFHIEKGGEFHQLNYHFLIPGLTSLVILILGLNGILPLYVDPRSIMSIIKVGMIVFVLIDSNSFLSLKILGNPVLIF